MAEQISSKDKTSLVIDREKLAQVQGILATRTIAETVDAALTEVIRLDGRRRLIDRIHESETGGLGPPPDELRRLRAR